MKVLQSSIFRAICAIIVGALLVKYREQTVTWITITIGVMFFVSGLISFIAYFAAKRRTGDIQIFDAQGNPLTNPTPSFPLVGIGSMILGGLLALAPNTFVNGLMYVLAAILILGALNQFFNLGVATRFARIGLVWWAFPSVILLIGILAILKPSVIASAPLFIIGWCMMAYGVVDLINAIKIHQCRRAYVKAHQPLPAVTEDTTETNSTAENAG
jgi:uncharacterized membrane protein HdeD (DUF308 family)